MQPVLITGGSGFFGGILKRRLLSENHTCINLDVVSDSDRDPRLLSIQGDLRDTKLLARLFREHSISTVFHCAALLAHGSIKKHDLWSTNVTGTRDLAEACRAAGVRKFIFTSTNCLWASNAGHAIRESEPPAPVEIYGRSKLAAERALAAYSNDFQTVIFRCPTIIDSGRLGLLAILFDFIREGKRVWMVGNGENRYQFIYAQDLVNACLLAMQYDGGDTFNVGSENVRSLREIYQAVIDSAETGARVARLPETATIAAMKLAHFLKISPLGPYHYRMIAEDFEFDTTKIRQTLGWRPTMTNEEMLVRAYQYYAEQYDEIHARKQVSAHSKPASMGIIRLLKWIS